MPTASIPVEDLAFAVEYIHDALKECEAGSLEEGLLSVALDNIEAVITRANEAADELLREQSCTCTLETVHATDIDPPGIKRDRDCPTHGIDPDRARDEWLERRGQA